MVAILSRFVPLLDLFRQIDPDHADYWIYVVDDIFNAGLAVGVVLSLIVRFALVQFVGAARVWRARRGD